MDLNIYCLYGNYNVGKTYLADKFVELHSDNFVRLSFAQKVKENFVKEVEPSLTLEDLNDREIKEKHRREIINYAENMKKIKGEDVWVKIIVDEIEEIHKTKNINNFIIDDLRFVVEYETLINKFENKIHLIHVVSYSSDFDPHTLNFVEYIDVLEKNPGSSLKHYTLFNSYTDCTLKGLEKIVKQTQNE